MRKKYSAEFKAKVALEAIKEQRTINEIASENDVHPNQVGQWKKEVLSGMARIFSGPKEYGAAEDEKVKDRLYSQIGQLKVELDWLKKKMSPFK
jgi:transposase-like protein